MTRAFRAIGVVWVAAVAMSVPWIFYNKVSQCFPLQFSHLSLCSLKIGELLDQRVDGRAFERLRLVRRALERRTARASLPDGRLHSAGLRHPALPRLRIVL